MATQVGDSVSPAVGDLQPFVVFGVDENGNKVRQPVPAKDRVSAVRVATELQIQVERVVSPTNYSVRGGFGTLFSELRFFFSLRDSKIGFWSDVSESVRSGESMSDAIAYASKNTIEPRFRSVLLAIQMDTQSTRVKIHEAMARHPEVFTAFEIDVVRLATQSEIGIKDAVDRIVLDLERDRRYYLRRVGLELSPRATTIVALLMCIIAGKLVPGVYAPVFATHVPNPLHFGPWVTVVSGISNLILSWYGLLAIGLLLPSAVLGFLRLRREPQYKLTVERMRHANAWASRLLFPMAALDRKRNIERMCSLYAMLLGTGKRTFLQATEIVARTIDSEMLRTALEDVIYRCDTTKVPAVDSFAQAEPVVDPVTVRRFRTAALKGNQEGGLSGMFASRAVALREELDLRDFERVVPRIQMSAAIPLVFAMVAVGMTVYEPVLILLSNSRIR